MGLEPKEALGLKALIWGISWLEMIVEVVEIYVIAKEKNYVWEEKRTKKNL